MSWRSRVAWTEGMFLRPHHFQQADRSHHYHLNARVQDISPYPWGFSELEIDRDLALQGKMAIRSARGVMPDGTPFSIPDDAQAPEPVVAPENAAKMKAWLCLPLASLGARDVDQDTHSGSRYMLGTERLIDTASSVRDEEEISIAEPRFSLELRAQPKPGFAAMSVARILEFKDRAIIFDDQHVPPLLLCGASRITEGWMDRVIGWIDTKVDELSRYAADPSAGGGLQSADYLVLQLLNRHGPVLNHLKSSRYTHPERLYEELLRLAGELSTFATQGRRPARYPAYDHDDIENVFAPLLRDLQEFMSLRFGRRAIRLDVVEKSPNAYVAAVKDRGLLQTSTLILEVAAKRSLSDIQMQFPQLFKVGPNTRMNDIVHAHLPGIPLVHLPTPPPQLRAMADHVYFLLDKNSPLWPEFSRASGIGMHFSDDWPGLELQLWAVMGDRR